MAAEPRAAVDKPPAIFLMGPTASGKTGLAMALRSHLPCDIVSVDSTQVYRGLDIGSAKPDAAELAAHPHRLIDIRDPAEPYSVAEFRRDALREMAAISAAGRIPLLVGGTMLYFRSLLDGLAEVPAVDPAIRSDLERRAALSGWPALHEELCRCDPATAARLHPNHSQRICRALEVYLSTGVPLSQWQAQQQATALPYNVTQIAIKGLERPHLHARIEQRFDAMLAAGLVEEVRGLRARGDLSEALPAIRAVGYRQVWRHLQGNTDAATMRQEALAATRQLAKRQLTWLRGWQPAAHTIGTEPEALRVVLQACGGMANYFDNPRGPHPV